MDEQVEKKTDAIEPTAKPAETASLRPWLPPTFERLSLKEAMAGIRNIGADLGCS